MCLQPEQLYQQMFHELQYSYNREQPLLQKLECCFEVANRYAQQIQSGLAKHSFNSDKEEITFYKKWQPLFLAETTYYCYRYHAQLFFDSNADPHQSEEFRKRELKRLDKFIKDNGSFLSHFYSGDESHDGEWFLQDPTMQSNYSNLLGTFLALEKYTEYLLALRMN